MTFDADVEINIGTWENVTDSVRFSQGVEIKRGRSSEGSSVDASTCTLAFDNRQGEFSPRNPASPYFGLIGRNTPLRVRHGASGQAYLRQVSETSEVTIPADTGLSVGDIDVRIDIEPDDWSRRQELAGRWESIANGSWVFIKSADNTLFFAWTPDGTDASLKSVTSTAAVVATGRKAVRVTLDRDNGAAQHVATFYTADTIAGPWTQLGATVTGAGATDIYFDSLAPLQIGNTTFVSSTGAGEGFIGKIHAFRLYSGVPGSVLKAGIDFSVQEAGVGPYVDENANIMSLTDASVVDPSIRFRGEISTWRPGWDKSGSEAISTVDASGILRRLNQHDESLGSPIRRSIEGLPSVVAYWPCEDESGATVLGSAIGSGVPMTVLFGEPEFAAYEGIPGSQPIPKLGTAAIRGPVPAYPTGHTFIQFFGAFDTVGETDGAILLNATMTGSLYHWRIVYRTGGDLQVLAFDSDGFQWENTTHNCDLNGKAFRCTLDIEQDGTDVLWSFTTEVVGSFTSTGTGGTVAGNNTVGRATYITLNSDGTLETAAVGHVIVQSGVDFVDRNAMVGYVGENAARRIYRLCGEEGIGLRHVGDPDDTVALGIQKPAKLLDLIREAERSDGGLLYEPRDMYGLAYRTRLSLYSQAPALTLDYDRLQIDQLDSTDDDQQTLNDLTVKRDGGSSARYIETMGVLSVADPPTGVGKYDAELTLSLLNDSTLLDHASWRVHLGTVDQPRFTAIGVELAADALLADTALTNSALAIDMGDRLVMLNPPVWLPPDDVTQLAQGFTEAFNGVLYSITWNGQPETPWQVAVLDDPVLGLLDAMILGL
jgi:hypothetical protein